MARVLEAIGVFATIIGLPHAGPIVVETAKNVCCREGPNTQLFDWPIREVDLKI